jgi:hypothetical protein
LSTSLPPLGARHRRFAAPTAPTVGGLLRPPLLLRPPYPPSPSSAGHPSTRPLSRILPHLTIIPPPAPLSSALLPIELVAHRASRIQRAPKLRNPVSHVLCVTVSLHLHSACEHPASSDSQSALTWVQCRAHSLPSLCVSLRDAPKQLRFVCVPRGVSRVLLDFLCP